jgi:hypothetical protein
MAGFPLISITICLMMQSGKLSFTSNSVTLISAKSYQESVFQTTNTTTQAISGPFVLSAMRCTGCKTLIAKDNWIQIQVAVVAVILIAVFARRGMTNQVTHRTIDCFKVVVDVEPENSAVACALKLKWLEWAIANRIDAGASSTGPSGFTCYVNAVHKKDVKAWLDSNIS